MRRESAGADNAAPKYVLSVKSSVDALGGMVSERQLRKMMAEGRVPVVRIGGRVGLKPETLQKLIDENTRISRAEAAGKASTILAQ